MPAPKRLAKLAVVGAVAMAALLLNPLFFRLVRGDYEFGDAELRAAVEGTWRLTITPPDAAPRTLVLKLAQASVVRKERASSRTLVRSAAACGSRSLVKPAGACMDTTDMPLDVTLIAGGTARRLPEQAEFVVVGQQFRQGELSLQLGDALVRAMVTPQGEVTAVSTTGRVADPPAEVSTLLVRTGR